MATPKAISETTPDWSSVAGDYAVSKSKTVIITATEGWRRATFVGKDSGFIGDNYIAVTEFRLHATGSAFLESGAGVLGLFRVGSGWVQVANKIRTIVRKPNSVISDGKETYGFASGTIHNSVLGLDVNSVRVVSEAPGNR